MNTTTTLPRNMEPLDRPFTGWYVPPGFETYALVQRIGAAEYHHGVAHVYDDGIDRIIVRPGNRERYSGGAGYYLSIESMAGEPGQQFPNVDSALAEARRWVLDRQWARRRAEADIAETEPTTDTCPLHGADCPTWALLGADS